MAQDRHDDKINKKDAGAGLGMVLALVAIVLLIVALLWVAFAGVGMERGAATIPVNDITNKSGG